MVRSPLCKRCVLDMLSMVTAVETSWLSQVKGELVIVESDIWLRDGLTILDFGAVMQ